MGGVGGMSDTQARMGRSGDGTEAGMGETELSLVDVLAEAMYVRWCELKHQEVKSYPDAI
jgi:hypothetical protein